MSGDLWHAVDELTTPRSVKLLRDDGTADWTSIPSRWTQLEAALCCGLEAGKAARGSVHRVPLNIDAYELAATIRDVVTDALAGHDAKPRPTLPASLRALASAVVSTTDTDLADWWAYRVHSWCRQIDHTLRLTDQPQPRRIRGAACPNCAATHVTLPGPDGPQRAPALLIDFADGLVRCASCSCCGATYWRGDALLRLADDLTAHTLAAADALQ